MRNLNTVYWKFSLQMFYRRLKIQYICFIACLLTSLIIKQMRKISLTRSALVTGCILTSFIPLQGKAKNLFLEQGIQSFSGHARTDTRVTYKEKEIQLIQNDHTLLIAGQFVEMIHSFCAGVRPWGRRNVTKHVYLSGTGPTKRVFPTGLLD